MDPHTHNIPSEANNTTLPQEPDKRPTLKNITWWPIITMFSALFLLTFGGAYLLQGPKVKPVVQPPVEQIPTKQPESSVPIQKKLPNPDVISDEPRIIDIHLVDLH